MTRAHESSKLANHDIELLDNKDIDAEAHRISMYLKKLIRDTKIDAYSKVINYITNKHIPLPSGTKSAQLKRATDLKWWTRQLSKKNILAIEANQRERGFVSKSSSAYVSNTILSIDRQARINSEEQMKKRMLVNTSTGVVTSMFDIAQTTVSNPEIRRNELMCRIHGLQEVAEEAKLIAVFYTFTLPSKFHRFSKERFNKKWSGLSPIDGKQELNKMWNVIRNAFRDNDLQVTGFRITEPHAEGCPHWHMLLWMKESEFNQITSIMRKQALKVDGKEAGAAKNRFDYKRINPDEGSAVSYIAKYISKNVDGHGIEQDDTAGIDAASGAERVRAWATLYNVRQFTQIGGASVSVWRKLRSLEPQPAGLIEDMRQAASNNDYATYIRFQGGLWVTRYTQALKIVSETTGRLNEYDEVIYKAVALGGDAGYLELNSDTWEVLPDVAFDCKRGGEAVTPRNLLNNCKKSPESEETRGIPAIERYVFSEANQHDYQYQNEATEEAVNDYPNHLDYSEYEALMKPD